MFLGWSFFNPYSSCRWGELAHQPHQRSIFLMTPYHCKYRENSSHLLLNLSCSLPAPSPAARTPFQPMSQVILQVAGGNGAALSRLHCLAMTCAHACAKSLFQRLTCITNLLLLDLYFKVFSVLSQATHLYPTFNYI